MNEQIKKIRAEIERRITMLRIGCKHSEANELLPILSFIDSLQEEPKESWPPQDNTPAYASTEYKVSKELTTNPNMDSSDAKCGKLDELEEEVHRYWNDHVLEYRLGRVADIDFLHLTARHFAEWQKKQDQETIELAEDHAMLAGRMQMKEEMMREAVDDCTVVFLNDDKNWLQIPGYNLVEALRPFKVGDKVKLIILKDSDRTE